MSKSKQSTVPRVATDKIIGLTESVQNIKRYRTCGCQKGLAALQIHTGTADLQNADI
jgi:hypothetical protein